MALNAQGVSHSGYGRGPSTGKLVGIGLVILIHIGLIYAILVGLDQARLEFVPPPIETKIIDQQVEKKEAPPPPKADIKPPPPVYVPPPEVMIQTPAPTTSAPAAITTQKQIEQAPPPPPPQARVEPRLDKAHSREPEYPPSEARLGHEGSAIVEILIDSSGKVQDVKIVKSTGFPKLDEAAIEQLKNGSSYRFIPGTLDGKPAEMRIQMKYTFRNPND